MWPARNKSHYDLVRIVMIWHIVKLRMEKEQVGICRGSKNPRAFNSYEVYIITKI